LSTKKSGGKESLRHLWLLLCIKKGGGVEGRPTRQERKEKKTRKGGKKTLPKAGGKVTKGRWSFL